MNSVNQNWACFWFATMPKSDFSWYINVSCCTTKLDIWPWPPLKNTFRAPGSNERMKMKIVGRNSTTDHSFSHCISPQESKIDRTPKTESNQETGTKGQFVATKCVFRALTVSKVHLRLPSPQRPTADKREANYFAHQFYHHRRICCRSRPWRHLSRSTQGYQNFCAFL